MKKMIFLLIISLSCLFNLFAQADTLDPMRDDYMIAKLSQIVALSTDNEHQNLFLDVQNHSGEYTPLQAASAGVPSGAILQDVIGGDFDGDGQDEMVTCYFDSINSEGFVLDVYEYHPDSWRVDKKRLMKIPHEKLVGQTRMTLGNFDADPHNELVLSYVLHGLVHFTICDIDSLGQSDVILSVQSERGPGVYYTQENYYGRVDMPINGYAIACNDFDKDGISEIVFVRKAIQTNASLSHNVCIYKFDPAGPELYARSEVVLGFNYGANFNYFTSPEVITTDLDNDGQEEVVLGFIWQEDYEWERWPNADQYFRTFTPCLRAYKVSDVCEVSPYSSYVQFEGWQYHKVHLRPENWGRRVNVGMSLIHADLDMDGEDEILFSDARFLNIVRADPDQKSFARIGRIEDFKSPQRSATRTIAVDYLMYDSSSTSLLPRILSYTVSTDPVTVIHEDHSIYQQGNNWLTEYHPSLSPESGKVSGLYWHKRFDMSPYVSKDEVRSYFLVTPDFDGGGLQLGSPKRIHKRLTEPVVVMNTPPVHFDVFDGEALDICKQYFADDPPFQSRYETEDSQEEFFQTEVKRSVGFAAGLKIGNDKEKDIKFGGSIEAKVARQWDNDSNKSETSITTIVENNTNELDDAILLQVTEFYFWEYPVYLDYERLGNILVLDPVRTNLEWQPATELMLNLDYEPKFVPQHEIGNVLSYPAPFEEINDMGTLVAETTTKSIDISNGGQGDGRRKASVEISYETIKNDEEKEGSATSVELNSKAFYGVVTVSLDGNYKNKNIETHTSTIKSSWNVACYLGPVDKQYSTASYDIKPYVYWRKDGALTTDFSTDPTKISGSGSWWEKRYGTLPDPTCILPFLHHEAKGILQMEDYKYFTRDILTAPDRPEPGDTVTIRLTLRNFSLKDLEESLKIKLYLGHPDGRGELIVDPKGQSFLELSEAIDARGYVHLFMDWVVPDDIAPLARIFARIDVDDEVEEVHEDNNLAFTEIKVLYATGTMGEPEEVFTRLGDDKPGKDHIETMLSIFPNPSSQKSSIRFQTTSVERVSLEIYNTLGELVELPLNQRKLMGLQEISLDVTGYPAGIYICRLLLGDKVFQKKLVVR